jgi:8-oxo-dGTP diphosphatase
MAHPPAANPPIPVVAAVLTDATGRILLAQRPAHKSLALKWEFPGGKVEVGEPPEAALARELREELGIAIAGLRPLARFTYDYGFVHIAMIPFVCQLAPGSPAPHPHEHTALAWVALEALPTYDLAPADLPIVAELLAAARQAPSANPT